jgi:hypothetical protein
VTTDDEMKEETTPKATEAEATEAEATEAEATEAEATEAEATATSAPAVESDSADEAPIEAVTDGDDSAAAAGSDDAEPEEAASSEDASSEEESAGEPYDPTVAGAAAHVFGISRPEDEYGSRAIDRDAMSDDELLSMGVEVDEGPGVKLIGVFVAFTVILIVSGIATAALFGWVAESAGDSVSNRVHPTLTEARAESAEVLNAYEQIEPAEGADHAPTYRVPIDVAMDILVEAPGLLVRHDVPSSEANADEPELEPPAFEGFEAPRIRAVPTSINVHSAPGVGPGGTPLPTNAQGQVVLIPTGSPAVNTRGDHAGNGHDDHAGHDHAGHGHDDHAGHDH